MQGERLQSSCWKKPCKNEVSKNEVSKNEVSKNEVSKNEVSKNEVSKSRIRAKDTASKKLLLSVEVQGISYLLQAAESGADIVYIPGSRN